MRIVKVNLLGLLLIVAGLTPAFARVNAQNLTWDAYNRLVAITAPANSYTGYTWTTVYDGFGRRVETTYQPSSGTATNLTYYYDPQVEFLELGRNNSTSGRTWNVYGPDRSGTYGGAQGIGGLDAIVTESAGAGNGSINNYFGDALGAAIANGSYSSWGATLGGYGEMPGSSVQALQPQWRGHYEDQTGFYSMGARYYDPQSGRFLSADPLGHAASMDLYSYCNGDPVNGFDPDGRCVEDAYNGGPGADLLRAGGNYLNGIAPNLPDPTLAFGASYVGGLMNEVGGVNLHSVVNSVGQYGSNVNSEYQQYGLGTATEYAATSWNVGAIESAVFNINPVTAQPVGSGLDRFELGLQGVAGTTAVVAPIDAGFNSLTSGATGSTLNQLSNAANQAIQTVGPGSGSVYGTLVHSAFQDEVEALGNPNLFTEQHYLNGVPVDYGTPGSIRIDVGEGTVEMPTTVYDLKTGSATLTPGRIQQIQSHLPTLPDGTKAPVIEVRPGG